VRGTVVTVRRTGVTVRRTVVTVRRTGIISANTTGQQTAILKWRTDWVTVAI